MRRLAPLVLLLAIPGAAAAQTAAPAGPPPEPAESRQQPQPALSPDELFEASIKELFALTPEQIERLRDAVQKRREAILSRDIQCTILSSRIDFTPGAPPTEQLLSPGIASALTFTDASGKPWPVTRHTIGDSAAFQIIQNSADEGGHSMTVTPLMSAGSSNLVVYLKDAPVPLILLLRITPNNAHCRHDFLVAGLGPNADVDTAPPAETGEAGTPLLLTFLSGADLPDDATPVTVTGIEADAWIYRDRMYVRSRHTLISPSWGGQLAGPNNYKVWLLEEPTSQLLFSSNGRIYRARASL